MKGLTSRKKSVLTKADWDQIERDNRRAEREPDPRQITLLPPNVKRAGDERKGGA